MKHFTTCILLVITSAVIFSCSSKRYGHLKKVKKNEAVAAERKITSAPTVAIIPSVTQDRVTEMLVDSKVAVANAESSSLTGPLAPNAIKNIGIATAALQEVKTAETAGKEQNTEVTPSHTVKKKKKSSGKSQVVALVLCWLVGIFGIHRFYLGYTAIGIIQLLTLGGCGVWALVDLIRIILGDLEPADGPYEETL